MIFKGYKIRVRCIDWEQIEIIDKYWDVFTTYVNSKNIVGLGMNWTKDYLYFDYAIGTIDNECILKKLKNIDFSETTFNVEYIEIELPNTNEWKTFKGKDKYVKEIYENDIDCYDKPYDYELEYLDGKGNIEIKIHYKKGNKEK